MSISSHSQKFTYRHSGKIFTACVAPSVLIERFGTTRGGSFNPSPKQKDTNFSKNESTYHLKQATFSFLAFSLTKKGRPTLPLPQKFWSGKRVSNSRPQPWQGCALPTELFPPTFLEKKNYTDLSGACQKRDRVFPVNTVFTGSLETHRSTTHPLPIRRAL